MLDTLELALQIIISQHVGVEKLNAGPLGKQPVLITAKLVRILRGQLLCCLPSTHLHFVHFLQVTTKKLQCVTSTNLYMRKRGSVSIDSGQVTQSVSVDYTLVLSLDLGNRG